MNVRGHVLKSQRERAQVSRYLEVVVRLTEFLEIYAKQREFLVEAVVQLARDAIAFLFLRANQTSTHVSQLLFGASLFRDVVRNHEDALLAIDLDQIGGRKPDQRLVLCASQSSFEI